MSGVLLYMEDFDRGAQFLRSNPAIRIVQTFGKHFVAVEAPASAVLESADGKVKQVSTPLDAALTGLSDMERLMLTSWFANRPQTRSKEGLSWGTFGRGP